MEGTPQCKQIFAMRMRGNELLNHYLHPFVKYSSVANLTENRLFADIEGGFVRLFSKRRWTGGILKESKVTSRSAVGAGQ